MSARVLCRTCLVLALAASCHGSSVDRTTSTAADSASSTQGAALPRDSSPQAAASSVPKGESADTQPKAARAAAPVSESAKADDDLQSEEREANPLSETVTLTLSISPPVKALVMWGSKQLARVAPDNPTVELQRPRNTGPLDLDIRAEGFLPHHTRLYTDRNDKVSVRLVRPADATGLLGYRSSVAAATAKGKTK